MSSFIAAPTLSEKAREMLTQLAESGQSEAAGVADCLNTIAENGEEQAEDLYLIGCAEEMMDACRAFIKATLPPLFDALMAYQAKGKKVTAETIIVGQHDKGGFRSARYLQGAPLWTTFGERAFVFADAADAQWFVDNYPEELPDTEIYTRLQ